MLKIRGFVNKVVELFCIVFLSAMTLLTTYQVITRYFFNKPSVFSEVLAKYMFVWLVLIGGAYVFGKREHMSIVFIKEKFSEKIQIIIDMVIETIILVFAVCVLGYGGYNQSMLQMAQADTTLSVPVGVIYLALPISAVLIVFYVICNQYENIIALTHKSKKEVL